MPLTKTTKRRLSSSATTVSELELTEMVSEALQKALKEVLLEGGGDDDDDDADPSVDSTDEHGEALFKVISKSSRNSSQLYRLQFDVYCVKDCSINSPKLSVLPK